MRKAVAEAVLATAGLNCSVVLVSHNALLLTSSRKLSRTSYPWLGPGRQQKTRVGGPQGRGDALHLKPEIDISITRLENLNDDENSGARERQQPGPSEAAGVAT